MPAKAKTMKFVIVPPYKGTQWMPGRGQYLIAELVNNMRERGRLEGIEIDIDDGTPVPEEMDHNRGTTRGQGEEFLGDFISYGVAQRVRYYSELGKYDAIIQTGDLDPAFSAARRISKIPFVSAGHAGIHVASLIGERTTFFGMGDGAAYVIRRYIRDYGFDHKVITVRGPIPVKAKPMVYGELKNMGTSSWRFLARDYPDKKERWARPESKKIVNDLTDQCVEAIEVDRVDSIIIGCPVLSIFEEPLRVSLDKRGYSEIPLVISQYAAIEIAKVLVDLNISQAKRAFPNVTLKAIPPFR